MKRITARYNAWDITSLLLVLLHIAVLAYFAMYVHVLEDMERDNPELDHYVRHILSAMHGRLPGDSLHPFLYAWLSALAGKLMGAFSGGQLVSLLSSVWFVIVSGGLARQLFGRKVQCFVILYCTASPELVKAGVRVAGDMLFWALAMSALYALVLYLSRGWRPKELLYAGVCAGLACATRYTGILLVPFLCGAVLAGVYVRQLPLRAGGMHLMLILMVLLLCLYPQCISNYLLFGSPFYSENWKVVLHTFQQYEGMNTEGYTASFRKLDYGDLQALIHEYPWQLVDKTGGQLWDYVHGRIGGLLALQLPWATGAFLLSLLFALYVSASRVYAMPVRISMLLYAAYAMGNMVFASATSVISHRYVLCLVPLAAMPLPALACRAGAGWLRLAMCLCTLFAVHNTYEKYHALVRYAQQHSASDITALRAIEAETPGAVVVGTTMFLENHSQDSSYHYFDSLQHSRRRDAKGFCSALAKWIAQKRAGYVLVNRRSSYGYPTPDCALNAPNQWLPALQHYRIHGQTQTYRVIR